MGASTGGAVGVGGGGADGGWPPDAGPAGEGFAGERAGALVATAGWSLLDAGAKASPATPPRMTIGWYRGPRFGFGMAATCSYPIPGAGSPMAMIDGVAMLSAEIASPDGIASSDGKRRISGCFMAANACCNWPSDLSIHEEGAWPLAIFTGAGWPSWTMEGVDAGAASPMTMKDDARAAPVVSAIVRMNAPITRTDKTGSIAFWPHRTLSALTAVYANG